MTTEICLWKMVRSVEQWNRLVVVHTDGQSVIVELQVKKPGTLLWTMQTDIPTTLEALQHAFEHVGDTWAQIFQEESGPVFKAERIVTISTPERVILLCWHVHHIKGTPYEINDDLEVAAVAFIGAGLQFIIESP